eukprot:c26885_g1_i1 orf=411-632(+)
MKDCKPILTPIDPNVKLSTHDDSELTNASLPKTCWVLNSVSSWFLGKFNETTSTNSLAGRIVNPVVSTSDLGT